VSRSISPRCAPCLLIDRQQYNVICRSNKNAQKSYQLTFSDTATGTLEQIAQISHLPLVQRNELRSAEHIGWPKNGTQILYTLTLPNINRFSRLFHCQNREKICNSTITKDPTTPQVCCYTILWNISVLKATIENISQWRRRLSVSSSSKADTLNIWCNTCTTWQLL